MEIINIDSSIDFPMEAKKICLVKEDFSLLIYETCPVILVSPSTMDLFYPPWKYFSYEPSCIRERIDKTINKMTSTVNQEKHEDTINQEKIEAIINTFWDNAKECKSPNTPSEVPACGVFVKNLTIPEKNGDPNSVEILKPLLGRDCIFLCLERIKEWSHSCSFSDSPSEHFFNILVAAVWFHEAAHAWIRSSDNIYSSDWGYIIEETLVQAYSVNYGMEQIRQIETLKDASLFLRSAYALQRFPYCAWPFWQKCSEELLSIWRDKETNRIQVPRRFSRTTHIRGRNIEPIFEQIANFIEYSNTNNSFISSEFMWKLIALQLLHWSLRIN